MADIQLKSLPIPLTGRLVTSVDGTQLGEGDFQSLSNMRYTDKGIKSIKGCTKINTSAPAKPTIKAAYHFVKDKPAAETHLLIQGQDATTSAIYDNTTAIPNQGNFTSLKAETTGYDVGKFSSAPDGCIAYGNSKDLLIWGGNESRCSGFVVANADDSILGAPTALYDYTSSVVDFDTSTYALMKNKYVFVASTRKLKGVKFYVGTANTAVATIAVSYWNSLGQWTNVSGLSDGTAIGGKTLAQTGTISFTATDAARLKYFNNTIAYWYLFVFGTVIAVDTTTSITTCTVDAGMQTITDIWDGVPRTIAGFKLLNGSSYEDHSTQVFSDDFVDGATSTYVELTGVIDMYVGFTERMTAINLNIVAGHANTTVGGMNVYYWNGAAWVLLSSKDGTAVNGAPLAQTGVVIWTPPDSSLEFKTSVGTKDLFYYYKLTAFTSLDAGITPAAMSRTSNTVNITYGGTFTSGYIKVSGATPSSFDTVISFAYVGDNPYYYQTAADEVATIMPTIYHYTSGGVTSTYLNYITGIPASSTVDIYKFPAMFQNRLVLCNNLSSESNSVLIGGANTSCVFNGTDSTKLYFGDDRQIVAAAPFFSRFSNNFYENLLVCKADSVWIVDGNSPDPSSNSPFVTYKIASMYGCAAPGTMTACDLGFTQSAGTTATRNVVIWQSSSSIVMFDGSTVFPISFDIDDIFDQANSYAIDLTMMSKSTAFYDEVLREWHWLYASKGSTTLNKEAVFDIIRKKWYTVSRGTIPMQLGVSVIDTNNNRYTYGATTTGFLERLEYGTTFDGTAITSSFQTGDIPIAGWGNTSIVRKIRPIIKAKNTTTNTLQIDYYADTNSTASWTKQFNVGDTTHRIVQTQANKPNVESISEGDYTFHSFKGTMITSNENITMEPIGILVQHQEVRQVVK